MWLSPEGGTSSVSSKERGKGEQEKGASGISSLFHLPAEFFQSAGAAIPVPSRSRSLRLSRGLRLTSPASWVSFRSPGAPRKMLCTQVNRKRLRTESKKWKNSTQVWNMIIQ